MAKAENNRKKTATKEGKAAKGPRPAVRVAAAVLALLLAGYILCGAALGSSRVRRDVCDRISERLGMVVDAGSSKLRFPFTMVLEDLKTASYESGAAGFMFGEVSFAPRFTGGWRIEVDRGSLRFVKSGGGEWRPESLGEIGRLPEGSLANISRFASEFCRDSTLEARGLTVRWVERDRELAALAGAALSVKPGELPGRKVLHHVLSVGSVAGPDGTRSSNVAREWLSGEGMPYKELSRGDADAGGSAFLEGVKQ